MEIDTQEKSNLYLIGKISEYQSSIDSYRASLNTEGVWLFLATLGCWSVSHQLSQLIAIAITFILFSHRVYSKMTNKKTFNSTTKELEKEIDKLLEAGDTKKARLYDLYQIRDVKLATINHLKSTMIFLLCYFFLAITLWHSITMTH